MRSSLGGEQECVGRGNACPRSRHGPKAALAVAKIDPVLAPIPASACDLDLVFPQGMERMSDPNVINRTYCVRCIW
jgi:hypothetical protein